jgi:ABC-type Fe3+-hydroxamate transport system substrate-binding protein
MNYLDQINRQVFLNQTPRRIISLVPSQTELLYDLGLEEQIVGITKFCVHPLHLRKKKIIIGGTKNFHFDKIDGLKPDLIIGNKEENYLEGVNNLAEKYPVWVSDVSDIASAIQMITKIGEITSKSANASKLVHRINAKFSNPSPHKGTVAYLIWNEPIMVAGNDTFIDSILSFGGFSNCIAQSRYPITTLEELIEMAPEYLMLSSEPFPFQESHVDFYQKRLPNSKVMTVDGEMFSWFGSRLNLSADYVKQLG